MELPTIGSEWIHKAEPVSAHPRIYTVTNVHGWGGAYWVTYDSPTRPGQQLCILTAFTNNFMPSPSPRQGLGAFMPVSETASPADHPEVGSRWVYKSRLDRTTINPYDLIVHACFTAGDNTWVAATNPDPSEPSPTSCAPKVYAPKLIALATFLTNYEPAPPPVTYAEPVKMWICESGVTRQGLNSFYLTPPPNDYRGSITVGWFVPLNMGT